MAHAFLNRAVRTSDLPEGWTPWYVNPGRHCRLLLETPGLPDYQPRFLLEDDVNQDHILLLENA